MALQVVGSLNFPSRWLVTMGRGREMVGGGGFWPVMLFFLSRAGKGGVSEQLASEVRLVCPHGVHGPE
jgi:hypothetical protein